MQVCNKKMMGRRKFSRINCSRFACSCTVKTGASQEGASYEKNRGALLINISSQGIRFESNFQPSAGEHLSFKIRPIEGPEVAAMIKVTHTHQSEKSGFYRIGSEFHEISEQNKRNLLVLLDTIGRLEQNLSQ